MKKTTPFFNKLLAFVLGVLVAAGTVYGSVTPFINARAEELPVYILNASELETSMTGTAITSSFKAGDDDFFVVLAGAKTGVGVTENAKGMDNLSFTKRLQLSGTGDKEKRAVMFRTGSAGKVTIYSLSSNSELRSVALDSEKNGKIQFNVHGSSTGSIQTHKQVIDLPGADTYYIYSDVTGGYNIYYIMVEAQPMIVERAPWNTVAAPAVGTIAAIEGGSAVNVTVNMIVGDNGADVITVNMYDGSKLVNTVSNLAVVNGTSMTLNITPEYSANYSFEAVAARDGESETKKSVKKDFDFILPLATPTPRARTIAERLGNVLEIVIPAVTEATSYNVEYKRTGLTQYTALSPITVDPQNPKKEYSIKTPYLTVGQVFDIMVYAMRGAEKSESGRCQGTVRAESEYDWQFAYFGESVTVSDNTYSGNIYDGLNIRAMANVNVPTRGKIQDNGADGLSYYYTAISKDKNFELNATVNVVEWKYTNGQEGFVVLARDAAPLTGQARNQYSNSFGFVCSKVEYWYDSDPEVAMPSVAGDTKITMKLGIGARTITNITNKDVFTGPEAGQSKNEMVPLEWSRGDNSSGEYNIVANGKRELEGQMVSMGAGIESFKITLKKTNTGFHVIYTDSVGRKTEEILYDWEELFVIDEEYVYVGFGAARAMVINVTDVLLTLSDPATDPPADERPIKKIPPIYRVTSSNFSGTRNHTLRFTANAEGTLEIRNAQGQTLKNDIAIKFPTDSKGNRLNFNPEYQYQVQLAKDYNGFSFIFTPDPDFKPDGEYSAMSDYGPQTITHAVTYRKYGLEGDIIYVTPGGSTSNNGSYEKPIDLASAFRYVQAGQTIMLKGGTYKLESALTVARGTDGTKDKPILVIPEDETNRPVLDFQKVVSGFTHWGNWWYFRGFDVARSMNGQKGIQVSGSNNIFDQIHVYENGNTGIQISGTSGEPPEKWPSNNLILNCTSYRNADIGRTDADGFAAKLTTGDGNVFDGCISYDNADDGYDLYAKMQTGPIGVVTIRNSLAYQNGNNGFKLGGTSIPGRHVLENCITYENAFKGIDSNSCPDIVAKNCITYDNGSHNVAYYTNNGNTDFRSEGVISFRSQATHGVQNEGERILPVGQPEYMTQIFGSSNFFWDDIQNKSSNSNGVEVTADWFISLDTSKNPTRYADGSINMNGLLQLSEKALQILEDEQLTAGAVFTAGLSPSQVITDSGKFIDKDFVSEYESDTETDPDTEPKPEPKPEPGKKKGCGTVTDAGNGISGGLSAIGISLLGCALFVGIRSIKSKAKAK